ncbi:MAG: peptidylprolyl isomerase [Candidatus Omnitrophica bacterium]|nr:peptidylprolyl isomerase [Candidatus Omnitrophota bacterium]
MSKEVISFNYTLTDKDQKVIDASGEGHPLIFITESGQIIPGLENVLMQMKPAEKKTVTIPSKEAYGAYNQTLVYKVSRSKLPTPQINMGDVFEAGNGKESFPVSVIHIEGDDITLDGNHPLAGQDLTFAVEIVERRIASVDEVAHGHVHGTGGCHH